MRPSSKIWMGITGVALITLGITCLFNPGATMFSISTIIGIMTLVSGFSTIVLWANTRYFLPQGGMLLSGILQILVGVMFLNNKIFVATALPVIFAFWLLVEGIILAIRSADFKAAGFRGWWAICLFGIGAAVLGFYSLRQPLLVGGTAISALLGIGIILLGVFDLVALIGVKRFEKRRWGWIDSENGRWIDEQ